MAEPTRLEELKQILQELKDQERIRQGVSELPQQIVKIESEIITLEKVP